MTTSFDEQATQTTPERRRRRPPAPAARLHVVHPPAVAGVHPLPTAHPVQIGRARGPGLLTVPHSTASRRHALVQWQAEASTHVVTDLGSHNGSRVNARAITAPTPLNDGDVLRFGEVIAVHERGPQIEPPAVPELPGASVGMRRSRADVALHRIDHPALAQLEAGEAADERGTGSSDGLPQRLPVIDAHGREAQLDRGHGLVAAVLDRRDAQLELAVEPDPALDDHGSEVGVLGCVQAHGRHTGSNRIARRPGGPQACARPSRWWRLDFAVYAAARSRGEVRHGREADGCEADGCGAGDLDGASSRRRDRQRS